MKKHFYPLNMMMEMHMYSCYLCMSFRTFLSDGISITK